jgi:hypothetical protein
VATPLPTGGQVYDPGIRAAEFEERKLCATVLPIRTHGNECHVCATRRDTPEDNLRALVNTAHEFGRYPLPA